DAAPRRGGRGAERQPERGQHDEALAAYAAHAAALADQLGADPDPAVVAAHADLLRAEPSRAPRLVGVRTAPDALLGRDDDLAALDAALRTARLVTVIGPGGMGKTRIAHEVARLAAPRFARVLFVELAGTRTAEDVLAAVAETAGARGARTTRIGAETVAPDLLGRAVDALAAARTLLVLDNCEHVVDAAAALADDVLGAVPDLAVLATSRIPLLVPGEHLHPLPPLPTDTDAADLFARRARAARPDVRLDPDAVRRIVTHLDGLPLAIELAAARLRSMSLTELEARLADRFAVLVGGSRTAPERHRTLFAVIDWSWRLLPADDQRAAALLGAFPDGFTAEAAGALLGEDPERLLASLVDQSLLVFRDEPRSRYRMLETVREFALAAAEQAGLQAAARSGLDAAAVAFVRGLEPHVAAGPDATALEELAVEEETLRAVLRVPPAGREAVVVAVFAALATHWILRGEAESVEDVLPRVRQAVARRGGSTAERVELLRALVVVTTVSVLAGLPDALRVRGLLRRTLRDVPRGASPLWEAGARLVLEPEPPQPDAPLLTDLAASPDPVVRTFAVLTRSQLLENAGRAEEALVEADRAERLAERHGLDWFRTVAGASAVQLRSQRGERAEAIALGEALEATPFARRGLTDTRQQDWLMGVNLLAVGRTAEARRRFERIAALPVVGRASESTDVRAIAMAGLAVLAAHEGDESARRERWAEAVAEGRRASAPWAAIVAAAALPDAVARDERGTALTVYRRLRPRTIALIRLGGPRADSPVVAAGGVRVA
ncbi:ATP-binding protein, partial [Amnibacterium endophyticum]